jgi:hypothetical protein
MIYLCGDTHCDIDVSKLNTKNFPEQNGLSKNNFLIICGDFGAVWDGSRSDEWWLKWHDQKKYTTLFVDGNHENHKLLATFPIIEKFGGQVGKIRESVYHLKRGEVYKINGIKIFAFGGAVSADKEYRVEGETWWPEEVPTKEEMDYGLRNLATHNYDIDIIVTHTCPTSIFNQIDTKDKKISVVEQYLETIKQEFDKRKVNYQWYFGHFHQDLDIEQFHCSYRYIKEYKY